MIDEQAVALVKATQARLAKMKDARPSEVLAVKEQFGEAFLALLTTHAAAGISDADKISMFDSLLKGEVERLGAEIKARMAGDYCDDTDSDHVHYVWESVVTGTFGKKIFEATNALENLFSRRR